MIVDQNAYVQTRAPWVGGIDRVQVGVRIQQVGKPDKAMCPTRIYGW